ncbi:ABC transporter permease [Tuwongella immobilis]|nr:FtsX-like permease family protein [Tuwongella immobilis]
MGILSGIGRLFRNAAGLLLSVLVFTVILAISLLPLASLLLLLPAILPQESVLSDTTRRRSWLMTTFSRIASVIAAFIMLVGVTAFAVEVVSWLPLPDTLYFDSAARSFLSPTLIPKLPETLLRYWPYVIMVVYLTDLLFLFAIGKVPLRYNYRNLIVRWRTTALTGVAFTVVVGLLVVMLAFVNGMNELTEKSGVPGNVIILSDGATDEIFSNLGYGDASQMENEIATLDQNDQPLPSAIFVKKTMSADGREVPMGSRETLCVVNQPIPMPPGVLPSKDNPQRRRFLSVRGVVDPAISGLVHDLRLLPGGEWFPNSGGGTEGGKQVFYCVIGEGIAQTLGGDVGKKQLTVGDTFEMGDKTFKVTGVMAAEGSTYGSEIWAKQNIVADLFGKKSFTTLVVRVNDDTLQSANNLAFHYRDRFKQQKLKAVSEREYFNDLSKTNKQFLYAIIVVAAIMAIGGVFGVMNTMFAAIAQRTKDIGVLRILGFKRWQVLVSFMLESLFIAIIGGAIGCGLAMFADGYTATSIISSGQGGGGKSVVLRLIVDSNMLVAGMLFTLVMGRLGGLIPAISGMRMTILDSLR